MKKLIRITTISDSLQILLKGQLHFLNKYYEVVGIASDTGSLNSVSENEGIRTINVPMKRQISLLSDCRSLIMLYKIFRQERPSIVHANTPKASLLSMVAALFAKVPHRIYTVTGLRFETTKGAFRFLLKTMERITCLCATKIIPEGDGVKQTLIQEKITRKPLNKLHHGNINGINLSYFCRNQEVLQESQRIKGDDAFSFIFIGRLVTDKGVNELINAFSKLIKIHSNIKLLLLGNFEKEQDPLPESTKNKINSISQIEYKGYQADVRPYLAAADMLILPSYREGFPNVIIQAGAMDLPCIVTDISGCNETIINGKNGIIIPKQDELALYNAMLYAIEHPSEVKQMSSVTREMVAYRYNQTDLWQEYLKMYNSLFI